MTQWSSKTKPTRANILIRIEAALAASNGAMDLVKAAGMSGRGGPLRPLDQAYNWLVDAHRKTRQR